MNVLVSGASGFIGGCLTRHLLQSGHRVVGLDRQPTPFQLAEVFHVTKDLNRPFDLDELGRFDAIFHLAGEPLEGRWTAAKKRRISQSRTVTTRHIMEAVAASRWRPKILISASAIGYYGDAGEAILDRDAPPGEGFLADVCQAWEAEARTAQKLGLRVVCFRNAVVLGKGGYLRRVTGPLNYGGGFWLGDGRQWFSWVEVNDLCRMYIAALHHRRLSGSYNAVAGQVRHRQFMQALGRQLGRPVWLPLPRALLKLRFGELADALCASQRVVNKEPVLTACIRYRRLESALARGLKH